MGVGGFKGREWVNEKLMKLKVLAAEGYTASDIAYMFETTRNSIIGACRRNNIPLGVDRRIARENRPKKPKVYRLPNNRAKLSRLPAPEVKRARLTPLPDIEPHHRPRAYVPPNGSVGILELTSKTCHFPLWGHQEVPKKYFFCGADTEGCGPYCPKHHDVVFAGTWSPTKAAPTASFTAMRRPVNRKSSAL